MGQLQNLIPAQSPVTVVANDQIEGRPIITPLMRDGVARTDNNGKPLGSIRLEQHSMSITNTFVNSRRRVAFLSAPIEDLERIIAVNHLVDGSHIGGKIVVLESLTPMWPNQTPKVNPQTGENVGVTVGGKFYPVYMQQQYKEDTRAKDNMLRTSDDVIGYLQSIAILNDGLADAPVSTQEASVPADVE